MPAVKNAQFNVLGLVDDAGNLEERYEYTPYGQRTTFRATGVNDPRVTAPVFISDRFELPGGADQPYALNPFGHQGLHHDEETDLIYNRARMLHPRLARFTQRDPLGYVDGMSVYAYYAGILANNDPIGLKSAKPVLRIAEPRKKDFRSKSDPFGWWDNVDSANTGIEWIVTDDSAEVTASGSQVVSGSAWWSDDRGILASSTSMAIIRCECDKDGNVTAHVDWTLVGNTQIDLLEPNLIAKIDSLLGSPFSSKNLVMASVYLKSKTVGRAAVISGYVHVGSYYDANFDPVAAAAGGITKGGTSQGVTTPSIPSTPPSSSPTAGAPGPGVVTAKESAVDREDFQFTWFCEDVTRH
jgi:RHS repeat-associated protein